MSRIMSWCVSTLFRAITHYFHNLKISMLSSITPWKRMREQNKAFNILNKLSTPICLYMIRCCIYSSIYVTPIVKWHAPTLILIRRIIYKRKLETEITEDKKKLVSLCKFSYTALKHFAFFRTKVYMIWWRWLTCTESWKSKLLRVNKGSMKHEKVAWQIN